VVHAWCRGLLVGVCRSARGAGSCVQLSLCGVRRRTWQTTSCGRERSRSDCDDGSLARDIWAPGTLNAQAPAAMITAAIAGLALRRSDGISDRTTSLRDAAD
jgi:hypothetical protein